MIAQTWPIKVPIDVSGYTKILPVSGANKATKTKNWWLQNFQFLFCKNVELYFFFVVAREGRRQGSIMLSVFVDMFVFLFLCREERKGDSFNCTVFDLPANCTAKYTSPSAEFWTYVNSIFIGLYSINKGFEHHRSAWEWLIWREPNSITTATETRTRQELSVKCSWTRNRSDS